MQIDLTQLILALIAIVVTVISGYIIPLLKSKLSAENTKMSEIQRALLIAAVKTGVYAAEQIYNSDQGQQKKSYVIALLKQQGFNVDEGSVDAAIEAAVKELKIEMAK